MGFASKLLISGYIMERIHNYNPSLILSSPQLCRESNMVSRTSWRSRFAESRRDAIENTIFKYDGSHKLIVPNFDNAIRHIAVSFVPRNSGLYTRMLNVLLHDYAIVLMKPFQKKEDR